MALAFGFGAGALVGAAAAVANDNAWPVWALAVVVLAEGLVGFRLWSARLRVTLQLHASIRTP